ncbi:ankyrin repeat and MYND domain-containing protein 2-like isoform X1 [Styela clava]
MANINPPSKEQLEDFFSKTVTVSKEDEKVKETEDEKKLAEDIKIEEKRKNMDPKHLELFEAIDKGNIETVKRLITEEKVPTNIMDEHDMSPLLQASYRGHLEIAEILLQNGADVNATSHTNFYTPLMMAAISGKQETVKLLLDAGASVTKLNSIEKTASDLAGFVGQHEVSTLIRNYLTLDRLEPYFTPQGDQPARITESLAKALQEIVMATNFHPVKIVITVNENSELGTVENLKKCSNVMDDLCGKCVRAKHDFDEVLALKLHHVSSTLQLCKEQLSKEDGDLKVLLKQLLKENDIGIKLGCEKLIRQSLLKFPYTDLPLLEYLVKALAPTKMGEEPSALGSMQTVFNGMQSMRGVDSWCAACGERKTDLRCSACKQIRYCSQRCQKLHWFVHKKKCVKSAKK